MQPATRTARVLLGILSAAWAAYAVHAASGLGGTGLDGPFNDVLYNAIEAGAALLILMRAALGRTERVAWAVLGAGVLLWSLGDVTWTLTLGDGPAPSGPTTADALYLAFYPAAYVAMVMLLRTRLRHVRVGLLADGLLVGLAAATVVAVLALEPIVNDVGSTIAAVAINLAYPAGDLLLLVVAASAIALSGWRPGMAWLLLAGSVSVSAVADVVYLVQQTNGSYMTGTWLDALWPASLILMAAAAWVPARVNARAPERGRRMYVIPAGAQLAAVGVLVLASRREVYWPAVVLAALVLVVAVARMAQLLRDNQRVLAVRQADALTDALTDMGNRRKLGEDLEAAATMASEDNPLLVAFYDLDGFKQYNDTYGHLAGDALLARLGQRLRAAVRGHGEAYRLGGDEFCTLIWCPPEGRDARLHAAAAALSEQGSGFNVRTSFGAVFMPMETTDVSQALTLADQRLYLHKDGRPGSAKQQLRDVLLQAFRERQPSLGRHEFGVRELSAAVGRRLEMAAEDLDVLARAAELHDVGKIAVPDAILEKPEPLSSEEAEFMQRHPVLGQRILAAAPALRPVAEIVRSTHERFDGAGYPDGLAGERIPLASRIIAVCDAYDAIVSGRPYREALSRDEAIRRLVAGAGTQFDPSVVGAFLEILIARGRAGGEPAPEAEAGATSAT